MDEVELQSILQRATKEGLVSINSMSVIQYIGAREGLLTREKIEEYLANAPEDYQPKKV